MVGEMAGPEGGWASGSEASLTTSGSNQTLGIRRVGPLRVESGHPWAYGWYTRCQPASPFSAGFTTYPTVQVLGYPSSETLDSN
jgi:hypothetical protein